MVLNIAGADQRQDDLFSTETLLAKGFSALKGLKVLIAASISSDASDGHYLGCRKCLYSTQSSSFPDS